MTTVEESRAESRPFEAQPFQADVARLLQLMVHSVYSDKSIFLRELIANAADACERLRYEAIAEPALLDEDAKPRITLALDADKRQLAVEDNGIGMSRDEMVEALGTIARSGTKAFLDRIEAAQAAEETALIGRFGVGFYSAFMVAERVEVISRRAGTQAASLWSSDGKGTFAVSPVATCRGAAARQPRRAPSHGRRQSYAERLTVERLVKAQSGHVPVPIAIVEKPGAEAAEITDGAALWAKPKAAVSAADYTDFYRSIAGQFDEPALTIHFHAEGRQDYTTLFFVPGSRPFDLFDPDRKGRIKLYVKRIFITDDAEILPRYLRFVRGLVDSADLPLNISREKMQESPLLAAIRKGAMSRVLGELERLADKEPENYAKIWENFGAVLKEGLYEDFERRDALLPLARFKTTASAGASFNSFRFFCRFLAQPQGLRRRAQDQSDGDLLSGRRRYRAALLLAASRRISRPRHRGFVACRPGRQFLGHGGPIVRRQAVQIGDARGGRPRAHSPHRRRSGAGRGPGPGNENLSRLHEEHAGRGRFRGARLGAAHRQRGLPGRRGERSRPGAGKAAGGRRTAELRREADP